MGLVGCAILCFVMNFLVKRFEILWFLFLTFAKNCLVMNSKNLISQFGKDVHNEVVRIFFVCMIKFIFWPRVRSKEV